MYQKWTDPNSYSRSNVFLQLLFSSFFCRTRFYDNKSMFMSMILYKKRFQVSMWSKVRDVNGKWFYNLLSAQRPTELAARSSKSSRYLWYPWSGATVTQSSWNCRSGWRALTCAQAARLDRTRATATAAARWSRPAATAALFTRLESCRLGRPFAAAPTCRQCTLASLSFYHGLQKPYGSDWLMIPGVW